MKSIPLLSLVFGSLLFGCNHKTQLRSETKIITKDTTNSNNTKQDVIEIRNLIRNTLKWGDTCKSIDLLPATFGKDSICTGFSIDTLNNNLEKLRKTGFFADEFIENYDHIIRTLDKKIKNHQLEPWNVGELPTFGFANDVSPWCSCQDNLSWDSVEVVPLKLAKNKGELKWNWGKAIRIADPFSVKFKVVKVYGQWKIAYLDGFDYTESTK
ncbi:MAG TPA: hypothetical protein VHE59_17105 [Mucilaginibacter sp.]|nr:hypothetical protein [Mucilaginibacter sp.]